VKRERQCGCSQGGDLEAWFHTEGTRRSPRKRVRTADRKRTPVVQP
jgi:hypothetical protein